ncbi:amino acid permease [Candidatus Woesearchaeota archaeon]|nr:amino acid permease [Candidatus Woesearchaeota archaeon]
MTEKKHELKKVLSYKAILLITINSIMGTGIFFLPALGAGAAGPASLVSWGIMAVIAIYISMCFAELTSMFPKAGGVYEFCKQAYGRFWSFIIGWTTIVAGNVTIAMLVVGAIHYLLPVEAPLVKIGISLFFIFTFNYIAYKGMETSATMLVAFAFITTGTLIALIIPGFFTTRLENFIPFFVFPFSSIIVTVFLIAETFFGWETATFLAAETKNGEKVMPKALVVGTLIIAAICLLFVLTSIGTINWQIFGQSEAPLSDLGKAHYGNLGVSIFTIAVYLAIIGSVAGWIVSAPRLILAMAEDKLFLTQFAKIHPTNRTPYKAIILQTIITTLLVIIGAGSYETLLHLLVPIVLVMYSAVLLSVLILRKKEKQRKRYFTTPLAWLGIPLVILFLLFLIVMWAINTHGAIHILRIIFSIIFLGIPIYILLELYYDERVIVKVNDALAFIAVYVEKFTLPVSVRKEMLGLLGDVEGKSVLEYGCGVGTLTMHLAKEVGPKGKIFATDESKHSLEKLKKRLEKKRHTHVIALKDQPNKIHPKIPRIDAVISEGMIGYLQKEEKVLKELAKRLRKGARIVFLDYDKFFEVIPNIEWLAHDDEIRKVFGKAGFRVKIVRKRGLLWQNIFIHGEKI